MTKFLTFALTAAVAMTAAGAAHAAHDGSDRVEPNQKFNMWFDKMDMNKDGSVSMAEHEAFSEKMYWMADGNRDGMITRQEAMDAKHDFKAKHEKYWEGKDARSLDEVNE